MVAGLIGAALFGSQLLAPSNVTVVHRAGELHAFAAVSAAEEAVVALASPPRSSSSSSSASGPGEPAASFQHQLSSEPVLSKVLALQEHEWQQQDQKQQQQQQQHLQEPAGKQAAGASTPNTHGAAAVEASSTATAGGKAAAAAEVEAAATASSAAVAAATAAGSAAQAPATAAVLAESAATAVPPKGTSQHAAPALMRHEMKSVEDAQQAVDPSSPTLLAKGPVSQQAEAPSSSSSPSSASSLAWAWASPFAPSTLVFGGRQAATPIGSTPSWRHLASDFLESQRPHALLVGTILQLLACLVSACGLVIQRAVATGGCQSESLWSFVGLALVFFSALPDAVSYLLAPQSLLAQLGCLEPLLVALLAMWALPEDAETLTRTKFIMTILSVVGAAGCAACAPSGSVLLLAPEAEEGALESRIATYLRLAMPLVLFLTLQEQREQRTPHSLPRWSRGLLLPSLAGVSLAVQRMAMAALGVALQVRADHGDNTVLALLMNRSVLSLGLLLAVASGCCLIFVWRGARQLPPHVFVPLYCAISAALQLLQSVFVLREYRDEPTSKAFYSLAACAVSLSGVAMLHLEYTTNLPDERPKVRSSTTGLLVRLI